jgi:hypothetical protein
MGHVHELNTVLYHLSAYRLTQSVDSSPDYSLCALGDWLAEEHLARQSG